jgi:hypothetical protein
MTHTFELLNSVPETIGYVSRNENNRLVLSLKGFGTPLIGVEDSMPMGNVDDFAASFMSETHHHTFVFDCRYNLVVVFDGWKYAAQTDVRVYHKNITEPLFSVGISDVKDVTGKTMIGFGD